VNITALADNQTAIALSRNPEIHIRTKHFNVKFYFQRVVLNSEEINLEYIPTEEQAADGLTKPLGPSPFTKFAASEELALKNARRKSCDRDGALSIISPLRGFEWFC
jgi:hypothetical protein